MSYFYVNQTPVHASIDHRLRRKNSSLAIRLNSTDARFKEFALLVDVEAGPLTIKERIQLTAELNALVAKHYVMTRHELEAILGSFGGFEEDRNLGNLVEIKWGDLLVRKFNGEVRKRVLPAFDELMEERKAQA